MDNKKKSYEVWKYKGSKEKKNAFGKLKSLFFFKWYFFNISFPLHFKYDF